MVPVLLYAFSIDGHGYLTLADGLGLVGDDHIAFLRHQRL